MVNQMRFLLLMFTIFLSYPLIGQAEEKLHTREDVLTFLKEANEAQVSLSEKERTEEEITEVLAPFFTDHFIQLFKDENVYKTENGKWITYGTDFALYYIPYFQFTERTKIVIKKNEIYVYEHFEESAEGPITYKDHYEAIIIKKYNSVWKISDYSLDFNPKEIKKERALSFWKTLLILPLDKLVPIIYRF